MPWTPFILVTVLFGVICGNRLLEVNNRYGANRYTAAASTATAAANSRSSAEPPPTSNSKNSEKYSSYVAFAEDAPQRRSVYGLESKLLKEIFGLTECGQNEVGASAVSDSLCLDGSRAVHVNSKPRRSFFSPNVNGFGDSTETLSDIFDVHNAKPTRTKLANTVEVFNTKGAGRNLNDNDFKSTIQDEVQHPSLTPQSATSYRDVDYYEDLLADVEKKEEHEATTVKRAGTVPTIGCDCKIKNDLLDLGQQHFPRYLLNAVCQTEQSANEYPQKCWRGSYCKALEYKVKVLTFRTIVDHGQKDAALAWLPDDLRQLWKFKTVTVAAGCFCAY